MRTIYRFLFTAAVTALLAASASAQMTVGAGGTNAGGSNGGGGGGGGGGMGGQNGSSNSSTTGLPFGNNGAVGVTSQSFQSTSATGVNATNVLGSYYANPMYQGRVGTTGGVSPGGFGAALYSTGSTGGTGGRAGGTAGRSSGGITSSSFGSSTGTGFGSTSGAGGRAGSTGGFGSTSGTGGFGSTGSVGGGGGFGGGMGGMGGINGQNQNVVKADRPVGVFINQTAASASFSRSPMTMKAQTELRTTFDNSTYLASGKTIGVNMTDAGIVHLSGKVASDEEKKLAIGLAQMTPGVRQVVSELTVQP